MSSRVHLRFTQEKPGWVHINSATRVNVVLGITKVYQDNPGYICGVRLYQGLRDRPKILRSDLSPKFCIETREWFAVI